jgi:hypothetical protein
MWHIWQGPNFNGLSIVEGAGLSGPYAMKIDIADGPVDPLQVFQSNLELKQGVTYTISFMAKADAPRTISVGLQTRTNSPQQWWVYWQEADIELTTEPQLFSFEYTHTGADDGGTAAFNDGVDFHFWLAGDGTDLYVDHIWVGEGTPPPPIGTIVNATKPYPADGALDVPRDVVLNWKPGDLAETHMVYFGENFDDVNDAFDATPQDANSYTQTEMLDFESTYYWRVDEVNAAPDFTVFKGAVWSFITEPVAYPIASVTATSSAVSGPTEGPDNTVNGSGLNALDQHSINAPDMWLGTPTSADPVTIEYAFDRVHQLHEMLVWNYNVQFEPVLGFGLKDVTVEYSENGTDWAVLGDVEFAQATARADYTANTVVAFNGVAAQYVRLTIHSGWGMLPQYGLSEVRFMSIPAYARQPQPDDGATDVRVNAALTWRAGRDAIAHEVRLGGDPDALTLVDTVATPSFTPPNLDLGATYYWQVDSVQEAKTWEGDVWTFATETHRVVEDFERYNDEEDRIYETWLDGFGIADNGSTVGHLEAPFAETAIVNSGGQSMPLFYDNTAATMSEAEYSFAAQDWTANGIRSLSLYFHGAAGNTGQLYVKINNTKIDYDGPAANIGRPTWQLWSIDLSTADNMSSVSSLAIGIEGPGANGVVYIDDIGLYPEVFEMTGDDITTPGDAVQGVPNDGVTTGGADNGWPAAETPDLAIDNNVNTKFLHFKGNAEPTGLQITPTLGATVVTALTFTSANDAPERDPIAFELYGSDAGIDGPYTLIAGGDIVDFAQATAWPRLTKTTTPMTFENTVAYSHYQITFPTVRDTGSANSMQIAEVELIGTAAP